MDLPSTSFEDNFIVSAACLSLLSLCCYCIGLCCLFCSQAICAIRDGLLDPLVRTGHKLSLYQRALRMKEAASCKKYRLQLRDLPSLQVQDVKHVSLSQCQHKRKCKEEGWSHGAKLFS